MNKLFFKDTLLNSTDVNLLKKELSKYDAKTLNEKEKLLDLNLIPIIKNKILNKDFLKIVLKNLNIQDFILLNKIKIQKNKREYSKTWHRDSGRVHQFKLISKKHNQYTKLGIYLQDNDKKKGGGIDIIKPLKYDLLNQYNFFSNFIRRFYYSFKIRWGDNFLNTKSGEIIGFSGLTFHQTTPIKIDSNIELDDRLSIYFLVINEGLAREIILLHNKKNSTQQIKFENSIELKKFSNCEFRICNTKMTDILENMLSD
jgi:hypothetical protein